MPVTIRPSPELQGFNKDHVSHDAKSLLTAARKAWAPHTPVYGRKAEFWSILKSSFEDSHEHNVVAYGNGFVHGAIRAFQQDLHLILRPDDVWLAILTQFSHYVNGNSEELRAKFVKHEGKQELTVDVTPVSIWENVEFICDQMTHLIQEKVVDPDLRSWFLPDFTTTTSNDTAVASVVMLGTMKQYFKYAMFGGCGLPAVTLLGEQSDWENILRRVERLEQYGNEFCEWSRLLVPVLKRMIETFKMPDSAELKNFWLRICHQEGPDRSGDLETLNGWITAFTYFDEEGHKLVLNKSFPKRQHLELDGVKYPFISADHVADGIVKVPVTIKDRATKVIYKTTFIAGSVGMTVTDKDHLSTFQPRSGWWVVDDPDERTTF